MKLRSYSTRFTNVLYSFGIIFLNLDSTLRSTVKKISKNILSATVDGPHNSSYTSPKSISENNVNINIPVPAPTKTSNKIISTLENEGKQKNVDIFNFV